MKRVLYLGLELPEKVPPDVTYTHLPIIQIVPRPPSEMEIAFREIPAYTHILFTSKNGVRIFCEYLSVYQLSVENLRDKQLIAVGKATAKELTRQSITPHFVAQDERAEGMVVILDQIPREKGFFLWPHAAQARTVLSDYFRMKDLRFRECILYDTQPRQIHPLPSLEEFDEIFFTSPSTVDAFLHLFGEFPQGVKLKAIGPVTEARLKERFTCL